MPIAAFSRFDALIQKQSTLGSFFSGVAPQTAVPKKAAPKKESKEKGVRTQLRRSVGWPI